MMKNIAFVLWWLFATIVTKGQTSNLTFALKDTTKLQSLNVAILPEVFKTRQSVKVIDSNTGNNTELRMAKLPGVSFHNGTIEVELAGEPMKNTSEAARGFVGIAFRIDDLNEQFECIYLRPTNGRANDQVRRNHSVQYFSHPGFPWFKLRKEFPEKYETYVDLEPAKWTKIKIEVKDSVARLFVHGVSEPSLIVSDLKLGENARGSIGLWIGPGTEAHFRNLVVTKRD